MQLPNAPAWHSCVVTTTIVMNLRLVHGHRPDQRTSSRDPIMVLKYRDIAHHWRCVGRPFRHSSGFFGFVWRRFWPIHNQRQTWDIQRSAETERNHHRPLMEELLRRWPNGCSVQMRQTTQRVRVTNSMAVSVTFEYQISFGIIVYYYCLFIHIDHFNKKKPKCILFLILVLLI